MVSFHRGVKFAWPLGNFLLENKKNYARQWGYACALDEEFNQIDKNQLQPFRARKAL